MNKGYYAGNTNILQTLVDCIVDLDTFEIYTDIEHYKFLEIIDCSLVKNAD